MPIFTWLNPSKKDIATGVTDREQTDLISGLFSAILTFSESISSETSIKQIKMIRTIFKYAIKENLVFILGYDSRAPKKYEPLVDELLSEIIDRFMRDYRAPLAESTIVEPHIFTDFSTYMEHCTRDERWKIERTLDEIKHEIQDLLLEILGPMGKEIFNNSLSKQIFRRKKKEISLSQLEGDIVYEISLLMDPAQAKQIGEEIRNIIYGE